MSKKDDLNGQTSQRVLRAIEETQNIGYALLSERLLVRHHSQSLLSQVSVNDALGRHLTELFPEFVGTEMMINAVATGSMPHYQLDYINRTGKHGETRYYSFTVVPFADSSKDVQLLLLVVDTTALGSLHQSLVNHRNQLRLAQEALERQQAENAAMTVTDSLTGLSNRHHAENELRHHIELSRERGTQVAVILVDLDAFKQYNDDYGHLAGDLLLQRIAGSLRVAAPMATITARYGGDEFLVVLADADEATAHATAERIRLMQLQETGGLPEDGPTGELGEPPVTVSVGVALCPTHADNVSDLTRAAGKAMGQAKMAGRNRSVVYRPGMTGALVPPDQR